MLDITAIEAPQDRYFIAAVPPVASSAIERQLVDAGYLAEVFPASAVHCGEAPLTMEEHDAALPLFGRYVLDSGLDAIVSNYDQGQIARIADALADDESFRAVWSQATGFPGEWLDGLPDDVAKERELILSDISGMMHGGDAEETPAQDGSRA